MMCVVKAGKRLDYAERFSMMTSNRLFEQATRCARGPCCLPTTKRGQQRMIDDLFFILNKKRRQLINVLVGVSAS